MAQQRKSIRRKSLRHKNRTTLKRGGVKEKTKNTEKITNYFNRQKTGKSNILKPSTQVTPPGFNRFTNMTATMTEPDKARIQKDIDAIFEKYLTYNGIKNPNSYPSVNA